VANISDLISALYPIIGLHTSTLSRHASALRVAGFLPAEDENLAALEAASFLAVVAGAHAPTEAVEAARVFTSLPLIGVEDYRETPATGAVGGTRWGIADLPPPPASLLASARRSFVAALEYSIHLAMQPDRKLEELPTAIGIMRNLRDPYALLAVGRAETDGTWHEARLIFASTDALSDAQRQAGSAGSPRMAVWAHLQRLGLLETSYIYDD
jgi:hypothetical protein